MRRKNMNKAYFHRLNKLSPTRMWINNPTPLDAEKAIAAGAISCTTNPAYSSKQIQNEETREEALKIVDEIVHEEARDSIAADLVQQKLVKKIMEKFLPLYEKNPGKEGFVSIQGDPFADEDPDNIINEARRYISHEKNYIAKIPATATGLKAIEVLIAEDVPIIATEIMSIAQALYTSELYQRVLKESGKNPPFYLSHITGIFDQHLKAVVEKEGINISPDILWQAGCIVARKQYRILKERGYPGLMMGGGARGLHHFTEMVGSEMHITINWKGTADKLVEMDPPVVYRMETTTPQFVIDELLEKVPDFKKAYMEDGLSLEEFKVFGPVDLFHSMFIKGWQSLLDTVKERRSRVA